MMKPLLMVVVLLAASVVSASQPAIESELLLEAHASGLDQVDKKACGGNGAYLLVLKPLGSQPGMVSAARVFRWIDYRHETLAYVEYLPMDRHKPARKWESFNIGDGKCWHVSVWSGTAKVYKHTVKIK